VTKRQGAQTAQRKKQTQEGMKEKCGEKIAARGGRVNVERAENGNRRESSMQHSERAAHQSKLEEEKSAPA